jgi:hypothetical protein
LLKISTKPHCSALVCKWPSCQGKRPTKQFRLCNCVTSGGPSPCNFGLFYAKLAFGSPSLSYHFMLHSPSIKIIAHTNMAAFKVAIKLLLVNVIIVLLVPPIINSHIHFNEPSTLYLFGITNQNAPTDTPTSILCPFIHTLIHTFCST